ncbi:SRPBCC domain-containing protein [Tengunoibacter tsumagoiensis]|uniref:SRPBCC domain-containing protein n=1 Tax=Tengunoibacter tsumagoiensis TaxID=2014871 RepID=UPI000F83D3BA|nr:SRPBCC domain-containing protein [Tengunoibacter tsumagoiensis]
MHIISQCRAQKWKPRVWNVITKPEYSDQWFGSQAEIDVRPGGKGRLIRGKDFEVLLAIVEDEKPHLFLSSPGAGQDHTLK